MVSTHLDLPNPKPTITGPSLIYISPDPPTENSFVKLWHSGKYETNPFPQPGKWSTTSDIRKNFGHMNMRIPEGLKAGQFVILPTVHDTRH
jgi:cellulase